MVVVVVVRDVKCQQDGGGGAMIAREGRGKEKGTE